VSETLCKLDNKGHSPAYLTIDSSRPKTIDACGTMKLTALAPQQTQIDRRTQQAQGNLREAELDAQLRNYHLQRINHLRAATGLPQPGSSIRPKDTSLASK
jgi:hypothetical protein